MKKRRGKKPQIPEKFYELDFAAAAKSESVGHIREKFLALEQIKVGEPFQKVAKIFNVDRATVKAWVLKVVSEGFAGLETKPVCQTT